MQLKIKYESKNLPSPDISVIPNTEPTEIESIILEAPIISVERKKGGFIEIKLKKTKLCPKCGLELPPSEFFKKKGSMDGLQSYCKEDARKEKNKLYERRKEEKKEGKK